jgi:tetratricopeptide (TPR) repeat protein
MARQPQNAAEAYKKSIAAEKQTGSGSPRLVTLYTNLGAALFSAGEKFAALKAYEQGIDLIKDNLP